MTRFLENLQKELFSAAHTATLDTKRMPVPSPLPPVYSQTVHHHHHPYFSQILFNNSFVNHYPSSAPLAPPPPLLRFGGLPSDRSYPFHLSTPKKRRTKVRVPHVCRLPSCSTSLFRWLIRVSRLVLHRSWFITTMRWTMTRVRRIIRSTRSHPISIRNLLHRRRHRFRLPPLVSWAITMLFK